METTPHWTNHWPAIAEHIAQRQRMLLASDFDGTLTAIARTPLEAVLPHETRTLLRRLASCSGMHVAIISGRSLTNVQMQVGIEGVFYVGNHGLELSGPGIELHNPFASKARGDLEKAIASLIEATSSLKGVFIEDKGATAAVHFRLASDETCLAVRDLVQATVASHPRLAFSAGKCVWEIRPRDGWNKGDALTHLTTRFGLTAGDVVNLGDDLTDEDAFRAARGGLTFRVGGGGDTAAHYRLRDAADTQSFLLCLLGLRSGQQSLKASVV
jgi:trehalose-phosphatase